MESLPVWERGLKSVPPVKLENKPASLPVWERGLKFRWVDVVYHSGCVAPRVGAWIEISHHPHLIRTTTSLPVWERGLKYLK